MSLKDVQLNNEGKNYDKLADHPDGEVLDVCGCGISQSKFGDMPYFVRPNGDQLQLPKRFCDNIREIMEDQELTAELKAGAKIKKSSRASATGGVTAMFDFV